MEELASNSTFSSIFLDNQPQVEYHTLLIKSDKVLGSDLT